MAIPVSATPLTSGYAISVLLLIALAIAGCATRGEKNIRIEPPPQAIQTTARTLGAVMVENGYQHLGLKDPVTGHYLQTVEAFGEYRMAFAAKDNPTIRVSVRVNQASRKARLRFYEDDRRPMSAQAEARFRDLVDRLALEFGRENVTVR